MHAVAKGFAAGAGAERRSSAAERAQVAPSKPMCAAATTDCCALDTKAMSYGSGQDGGYLGAGRNRNRDRQTADGAVADPLHRLGAAGVVGGAEEAVRGDRAGDRLGGGDRRAAADGDSPTLAELSFPTMELYAMPAATQTLLDDAVVDLDQWIAAEVEAAFAEQEGTPSSPATARTSRRVFDYTTVAEASLEPGAMSAMSPPAFRRAAGERPVRQADRPRLRAEGRLPAERDVGDEPQGPRRRSAS
jgi:predicted phage gp36 major capsid-like protein